ncbi:MAG: hypothetical protein IJ555_00580 [Ruminococcus sp.]|nr:hypothetical protein [Ruminococcus sp.]
MSAITTYEAEQKLRKFDDVEDRHWNECMMISQYDEENKKLRELLRAALKLFDKALWANYKDSNEAFRISDEAREVLKDVQL